MKLNSLFALVLIAPLFAANIARADFPGCPNPDGASAAGDATKDMNCANYTAFVAGWATPNKLWNDFAAARTAAGNPAGSEAPGTNAIGTSGYGTQQSRTDIVNKTIVPLVNPPVRANAINATAVRDGFVALFKINNSATMKMLGVTDNAANNLLVATVALPINQALLTQATANTAAAQANWNASQTEANAIAYWSAVRTQAVKQGMVDATNLIITNGGAYP